MCSTWYISLLSSACSHQVTAHFTPFPCHAVLKGSKEMEVSGHHTASRTCDWWLWGYVPPSQQSRCRAQGFVIELWIASLCILWSVWMNAFKLCLQLRLHFFWLDKRDCKMWNFTFSNAWRFSVFPGLWQDVIWYVLVQPWGRRQYFTPKRHDWLLDCAVEQPRRTQYRAL